MYINSFKNLTSNERLQYYRSRSSIIYPIVRSDKQKVVGQYASTEELQIADNALKNILIGQRSYPPYNYGTTINWHLDPYNDIEWKAQLHRFFFWDAMGKAYWHTGNEVYAQKWIEQFLDWRKNCPPDSGTYIWYPLNNGIRAYSLCNWFHYFIDSPSFTSEFLDEFLTTVYEHAVRLAPKYTANKNWGLMESEGLASIGLVFPEFTEASHWWETGLSRLITESEAQIYPDGIQKELSFNYHRHCITYFSRTAELAELNKIGIPSSYKEKINKMRQALVSCLKPNGNIPMFGDAWDESPGDIIKNEVLSQETSIAFTDAGYFLFRSSWEKDAIWLLLKCGSTGGWHSQPDNCSFELFAYGSYLMPDSGCYTYFGDSEAREWFRASARHQCLTVGEKNIDSNPRLLLWDVKESLTSLTVENQSYPEVAHRRNIFFVNKLFFIIVDEIISSDVPEDARFHFQFGPPMVSMQKHGRLEIQNEGAGSLLFVPFTKDSDPKIEIGEVSFRYGEKEARSAFAYRPNENGIFGTLLYPYLERYPTEVEVTLDEFKAGQNLLKIHIKTDKQSIIINRDLAAKAIRF